jgi:biopolymer transport protein ExbD
MAGGANGGFTPESGEVDDEQHEINVTPFIDVMLVLLIIFMVAAPLSTVDVPVNLPVSTAKPQPRPDKPLYVTMKADLSLSVGEMPITMADLTRALNDTSQGNRDTRVFLRGDKAVPYGEILSLMDRLREAGYTKVGLVALESGAVAPSATAASGLPQP